MGNPERPQPNVTFSRNGEKLKVDPVYERLLETAITYSMILEGSNHHSTREIRIQAQEALATVRDEVRKFGIDPVGFGQNLIRGINRLKGDEPDYELQSQLGDVPPVKVHNFGWREQGKKTERG